MHLLNVCVYGQWSQVMRAGREGGYELAARAKTVLPELLKQEALALHVHLHPSCVAFLLQTTATTGLIPAAHTHRSPPPAHSPAPLHDPNRHTPWYLLSLLPSPLPSQTPTNPPPRPTNSAPNNNSKPCRTNTSAPATRTRPRTSGPRTSRATATPRTRATRRCCTTWRSGSGRARRGCACGVWRAWCCRWDRGR